MSDHEVVFPVESETDLRLAIAGAGKLAGQLGFGNVSTAEIMTTVSELGRNILKYATRGRIRLVGLEAGNRHGVEICAQDEGPGIVDVAQALRDHYSTGGSLGLGLPGVQRMMDEFEIESRPQVGTRVRARKWR
jgi:serine/threonine-protein kinase RsbT